MDLPPGALEATITGKWRLALAGKALLLLSLAASFLWIALWPLFDPNWLIKIIGRFIFGYTGAVLA